jgi:hypothetical protein
MNWNTTWKLAASLVLCGSLTAMATFTEPSAAQIEAAANNPAAEIANALSGANAEQAANVVKAVLARVLALGLQADAQAARIAAVVTGAFGAIPAQLHLSFTTALGTAVAGSPVIMAAAGVVSQIQAAVATAGGPASGAALAQAFGAAYQATLDASAGTDPDHTGTEPPPLSTVYPGQDR